MSKDFDSPGLYKHVYLMLNPDFQSHIPFHSVVTEELIKWVRLGLKTVITLQNDGKNTKKTINSSKIHTSLAQGLV